MKINFGIKLLSDEILQRLHYWLSHDCFHPAAVSITTKCVRSRPKKSKVIHMKSIHVTNKVITVYLLGYANSIVREQVAIKLLIAYANIDFEVYT